MPSVAPTPIAPMDAIPFSVMQEARLRRLCGQLFITQVLTALQRTEERVAFFQLLTNVPDDLLEDMSIQELVIAVDLKSRKIFPFGHLHERLHKAWQGFGLIVDALVPTNERRQMVRHWFELTLVVADTRAKRPN